LVDDQSQQFKGPELKTRLEWAQILKQRLLKFERMVGPVSGILEDANRDAFVGQLVDSIHRIEYVSAMKRRVISAKRCDPNEPDYFDPLLGSIYAQQRGDTEESFWLVFLFTHFGDNPFSRTFS
jgi:Alpha-glutamyl/putrescinyl thymine pyrophosphorylase clade 3